MMLGEGGWLSADRSVVGADAKTMTMMMMMMMMMIGMRKHLVEAAIRGNDAAAPTITSYTSCQPSYGLATTQNNTLIVMMTTINCIYITN